MGVSDLWELLTPAAQVMSFKELSIAESRQDRPMIVGIDGTLWLTQCQAVFHMPRHAQMGRNPEVRALFFKLAFLNQMGVDARVWLDGSQKPSVKRDKAVRKKPHWLVEEFAEMIELFGFHHYTAPGEADAELAYLNKFGCINAVLSDDSDLALFGAKRIIRSFNKNKDEITVYTSDSMRNTPNVNLSPGGILLIVLMSGGDYDTKGLVGFGIHVAHALALCGFGDSLLTARESMDNNELQQFFPGWRQDLCAELASNSQGHLPYRMKSLATKIPETFPSLRILDLYARPITSCWSPGLAPPDTSKWTAKMPDLPRLALYCQQKFGWNPVEIIDKFRRLIFSGVFMRRLSLPMDINRHVRDHMVQGIVWDEQPLLSSFRKIEDVTENGAQGMASRKYKLTVAIGELVQWTKSRLNAPSAASRSDMAVEWIAAPLVEHYFPIMVNNFNRSQLPHVGAQVDFFDIPDSPEAQPVVFQHLGFVDLTEDDDRGEGGSGTRFMDGVQSRDEGGSKNKSVSLGDIIDLTEDSEEEEVDMVLTQDSEDELDMDIDIIDLT